MPALLTMTALAGLLLGEAAPKLVVSVGHAGAPTHAAFSGRYLVTAAWSNVAIIDLDTSLTVGHLPQGSIVMALAASPRGKLIAVGSCGHRIQLWDVKAQALVRRIALRQECAESLSFSPDGASLATGAYGLSAGNGLQVWDVRSGRLKRELARGRGIRHVVFGGDGRWLAGVDDQGQATVFEWPSGRQLRTYQGLGHAGSAGSAAIASRDGQYLAWVDGGLRAWDIRSGAEVRIPGELQLTHYDQHSYPGRKPEWVERPLTATIAEFLDDGRVAYSDGAQMLVRRLPGGPQEAIALAAPETESFGCFVEAKPQAWLAIRRDGLLLAGFRDTRTVTWDVRGGYLRDLAAPALTLPTSLQWSGSAGVVAWAGLGSRLQFWNVRTGWPAFFGPDVYEATGLALRPDGDRLAIALSDWVGVLDLATRQAISTAAAPETGVGYSTDGSQLAFAGEEGFGLFDESLHLTRRLATLEAGTSAAHVAFSPDGQWIAAGLGGPHPALRVWPTSGAGTAVTLDTRNVTHGPQPLAFSGDSRWLASFRRGRSLATWASGSWHVARTATLAGTGRALAFAPGGSRLAVAADGKAAVWDAATGRRLVAFSPPGSAQMRGIAWSPDGQRVVSSADDGVLSFWNAGDGRLQASLYVSESGDDWLLVTPDGRLDGSEAALSQWVAWRIGDRVVARDTVTESRRAPGLWQTLKLAPRP